MSIFLSNVKFIFKSSLIFFSTKPEIFSLSIKKGETAISKTQNVIIKNKSFKNFITIF